MRTLAVKQLLSGVLYVVTYIFCGGAIGLVIGTTLDKSLGNDHPHGMSGLLGLLLGTPIGLLVGGILGISTFWELSIKARLLRCCIAFAIGLSISLGMYLLVQANVIDW